MTNQNPHIPVLLNEVLQSLQPQPNHIYVDATFGAGGYSRAILKAADCKLYGIDRDTSTQQYAADLPADRFTWVHGNYSQINELIEPKLDAVIFDLGVSSMQLDQAQRGFSFNKDGALDMRMDAKSDELNAADIVNNYDEAELTKIIKELGEERQAKRVARAIINARTEKPITTTIQLAKIVEGAIHASYKAQKIHPATRTFQALRMYVNKELEHIKLALANAVKALKQGGKLLVVTFHSLEDRIVKRFFKDNSTTPVINRHMPDVNNTPTPILKLQTRKSIQASDAEIAQNPRARSARLRVAIKTEAV